MAHFQTIKRLQTILDDSASFTKALATLIFLEDHLDENLLDYYLYYAIMVSVVWLASTISLSFCFRFGVIWHSSAWAGFHQTMPANSTSSVPPTNIFFVPVGVIQPTNAANAGAAALWIVPPISAANFHLCGLALFLSPPTNAC